MWGERTGGEVGERWCCERAAESREEPWEATTSWAGDDRDSGSALPRGGRCLFAAVGDDAGAKEAALGLLHPAEPSWHRCCLPGWAKRGMHFPSPDGPNPCSAFTSPPVLHGDWVRSVRKMAWKSS